MNSPLQEAFYDTDRAKLQRAIPWVHLFRGFRLATRWQNLVLALVGVLLLSAGRWGLSYAPFSSFELRQASTPYSPFGIWDAVPSNRRTLWPCEQEFLDPPLPTIDGFKSGDLLPSPFTLLAPLADLVRPASKLFVRRNPWSVVADVWLHVLLVLAVGSLIGGAITRRVALEFGVGQEPSLRESLRYGVRDFPFSFGAPFISFVGIGLLLLAGRVIARLGSIPGVGETLAAVLWGLLLLFSLVMALILLGVAAAWPLMVAAHSCEGTDGFDALNRAYNYVFVRPWYAAWLTFVALLYGTAVTTFLILLTGMSVRLSEWIAAGPLSDAALATITADAPPLVDTGTPLPPPVDSLARTVGGWWQHGLAAVLTAFVYSYFWSAATLIYLLLRQSADACELKRIYVPKRVPPRDGPPLAGIPAAEQREALKSSDTAPPPSPHEAAS